MRDASRPRIAVAGLAIESSTFSPHRSGLAEFTVLTGAAQRDRYPFLAPGTDLASAADWIPVLDARALPGGAVPAADYAHLRSELLDRLARVHAEGPLDGLFLDLHGAMSVVGQWDAEADLCRGVRAVIGPDPLVSASLDLHGNVSRALVEQVDLLTCYRMAPHEDAWETRERAARGLVRRLLAPGGEDPARRRPHLAWVQVPVLLPGERTSTRLEPARGLYARVGRAAQAPGVDDAALWVGYAWADEPRCQAAVVVHGDDADAVVEHCADLARRYWEARDDFAFVGPTATFEEALERALHPDAARPFVLSDSGDNPTAGGAGDGTHTLSTLLARDAAERLPATVVHASVFDAEVVRHLAAAGVGARVDLPVGGRVETGPPGPARLRGTIEAIDAEDPVAGTAVLVRSAGGRVLSIVTERRKPYHHRADLARLGIDADTLEVLVVKIGYLEPDLHDLAADWILTLTPGGVDQDLARLGHRHLAPGVHPFATTGRPDLTPCLIR